MAAAAATTLQSLISKHLVLRILLTTFLCSLFYTLASFTTKTSSSLNPPLPQHQQKLLNQPCLHHVHDDADIVNHSSNPLLQFEPHHLVSLPLQEHSFFDHCSTNFTDYCPCHDPQRAIEFMDGRGFEKERHCPQRQTRIGWRCLTPAPLGYRKPFPWPKSRDTAWFSNVPFPKLTQYKKSQNWVRLQGNRFVFPGGGTSFVSGVKGYVDVIKRVVPLKSGNIRTVLDVGCGVASFAAALMDYNILTMSIAPKDLHEAQVQFALERGLPAMLGVLSRHRLPFPSRSFDMVHCSSVLYRGPLTMGCIYLRLTEFCALVDTGCCLGHPLIGENTIKDGK